MSKQIQREDTKPQILQDIYGGYAEVKKLFEIVANPAFFAFCTNFNFVRLKRKVTE